MAKYKAFPKVHLPDRTWPDKEIAHAPMWCSVDLRDGNQALAVPMGIDAKVEMFKMLVDIGFKDIEVGFPSASQIEFDFVRRLIDERLIPNGVRIQVLTQAREHLIRRTVESLKGAQSAIIHLYNSTSALQRKITFNMSREQIKEIAVEGTRLVKSLISELPGTHVSLEYSPESFSDTELDFAVEVCDAVVKTWDPKAGEKVILNLPNTVEWMSPNVHADEIEWFIRHIGNREKVIISLHAHNDRGTAVAATELGMMAGADRVEGTLFGNGERTGNLDIVTVALNMFSHGIDPELNLYNIPDIRQKFEELTGMAVPPRHPYAGDLVFTAFSGSHQDAIKKGMDNREKLGEKDGPWEVPYLPIDPEDIGRSYEAIIRINSQSGKGGVAYIMSRIFGYELPKSMHPEFGRIVNDVADKLGRELKNDEIMDLFKVEYLFREIPLELVWFDTTPHEMGKSHTRCNARVKVSGKEIEVTGIGNGPIDSFVHAMKENGWNSFKVLDFKEQAIGSGSSTEAVAYVQIETDGQKSFWGIGQDTDITFAGLKALVSAYNRSVTGIKASPEELATAEKA